MKKFLVYVLAALLIFSLLGCKAKPVEQEPLVDQNTLSGPWIGVCLPAETETWRERGVLLQRALNELDYPVEILYAENDPATQSQQMITLTEKPVAAIVVAAVDGMALDKGLQAAEKAGIPVIAYDRFLTNTDTVDGLVTFNYRELGRLAGQYIVEQKELKNAAQQKKSYNIEFFMGAIEDETALQFHEGLLGALQPYLDAGVLKSATGRVDFVDTYTAFADPALASEKLTGYLEEYYQKKTLDIICVASDEMAAELQNALATRQESVFITGLGGSVAGIQQVINGGVAATVYQNYPALAELCAGVVNDLVTGTQPEAQLKVDNQKIAVPAWRADGFLVTRDNYQSTLIDTGIYREDQFQ